MSQKNSAPNAPASLLQRPQETITVAFDVDGVISAVAPYDALRPEKDAEPEWRYLVTQQTSPGGMPASLVAEPVVQLLHDLIGAGHVDVRFHSSWWLEAADALCPALGLPRIEVLGTEEEFSGEARHMNDPVTGSPKWWKLAVVERWLADRVNEHGLLVWVEDEIEHGIESGEIGDELMSHSRLIMIATDTFSGLTSREVAVIRAITRVRG